MFVIHRSRKTALLPFFVAKRILVNRALATAVPKNLREPCATHELNEVQFNITTRNEFTDFVVVKELGIVAASDGVFDK